MAWRMSFCLVPASYLVPSVRCVFLLGSCGAGYVLESIILNRVLNLVSPTSYLLSSRLRGAITSL